MGDVYRALDTRLDRVVAVKLISDRLAERPEMRSQFERESRAVARLNHPNICTLLDVGRSNGRVFLVFEYLEGQTLADRLSSGALPPADVLRVAREILCALDHADRHGIVHRDLKPANVLLTKSGAKLLDFGLARFTTAADQATNSGDETVPIGSSGSVMGTLQYMAPEQLEGFEGDRRSDIFAFGAVVCEMATGEKAFPGNSDAAVIASVLTSDTRSIVPGKSLPLAGFDAVVQRCLAKAPEERWQSAWDILAVLTLLEAGQNNGTSPAKRGVILKRVLGVAGALGLVILLLILVARRPDSVNSQVRFSIMPPPGVAFSPGAMARPAVQLAVSPDGRAVAFVAAPPAGRSLIWIRWLDGLEPRVVPGTAGASHPFWSPDSMHIGYFSDGKLKRVNVADHTVQALCDAGRGGGGAWSRTGQIIFSPYPNGALFRISETGGSPTRVTTLNPDRRERAHRWPHFLPDGETFLFFVESDDVDVRGVYSRTLAGEVSERLIGTSFHAVFAEPGFLLFAKDGDLLAQPFDPARRRLTGLPTPVVRNIGGSDTGLGSYSVSRTGDLAHANPFDPDRELVWFARSGEQLDRADGPADYVDFRLSADGRIAVARNQVEQRTSDIFVVDPRRGEELRVTTHPALDASTVWSPDATRLVFRSKRRGQQIDGVNDLYETAINSTGSARLLLSSPIAKYPSDWSPDGRAIIYHARDPHTGWDVWLLPLGEDPAPSPVLASTWNEMQAKVSPNGRWIAFTSDQSGRPEVYVKSFPPDSRVWPVSAAGGAQPQWTSDGRELLFLGPDGTLLATSVSIDSEFRFGPVRAGIRLPAPGFSEPFSPSYAVTADGKRVLVNALRRAEGPIIEVILNWRARLLNTH
jgi:Tol biopolymer transport system component